jgi:uncharacterized protein YjbI with pentapeptide repeats
MLTSTLRNVNLDGSVLVRALIDDAYLLSCEFYRVSDTVYIACEELKALYGDTVARDIFNAIPEFLVDDVISAAETVLVSIGALEKHADKINAVTKLATDMLTATLRRVNLDGSVLVATLIDDANLVSDIFYKDIQTLNIFFEEVKALYGDTLARDIFNAIPGFIIDNVISAAVSVLKDIMPEADVIDDIAKLRLGGGFDI